MSARVVIACHEIDPRLGERWVVLRLDQSTVKAQTATVSFSPKYSRSSPSSKEWPALFLLLFSFFFFKVQPTALSVLFDQPWGLDFWSALIMTGVWWARQANKFGGGREKMDDGKKEFLFSCHLLKRREDSASHRE